MEKEKWHDSDFEDMCWHDSPIYNISLPQGSFDFILDIDYIYEWIFQKSTESSKFQIAPCYLTFSNILDLSINIYFENNMDVSIQEIKRINPIQLDSGNTLWTYIITTDRGDISFSSTGFSQRAYKKPIYSDSYGLGRPLTTND